MADTAALTELTAGMPIIYGGTRVTRVPPEIAERFRAGDRLVVVQKTGDLLLIPAAQWEIAAEAVGRASAAFQAMGSVADEAVSRFYEEFARRLEAEESWA